MMDRMGGAGSGSFDSGLVDTMQIFCRPILLSTAALRPLCCSANKASKLTSTFRSPQVADAPTKQHTSDVGTPFEDLQLQSVKVSSDPSLPLWVDVGCGSGRFLLLFAKKHGQKFNYLGADIRDPLITRANKWADHLGYRGSVHFIVSNMTISLESLLKGYPGAVDTIAIQFPDPQFKARHRKRHIVQETFVRACEKVLKPGGIVYFQSDVPDCSVYMREMFCIHGNKSFMPLQPSCSGIIEGGALDWSSVPWVATNPIDVPTERELHASEKGFPIYRMQLVRV